MKDWTGNSNSVWKTLAASNHSESEREQDDYYATDPIAIDKLLTVESPNRFVWECACGEGHLSKRLKERGFTVWSSDLIDRGYKDLSTVQDFLSVQQVGFSVGGVRYYNESSVQIRERICIKIVGIVVCWVQVLHVFKAYVP